MLVLELSVGCTVRKAGDFNGPPINLHVLGQQLLAMFSFLNITLYID
jgi:hypothetical protein